MRFRLNIYVFNTLLLLLWSFGGFAQQVIPTERVVKGKVSDPALGEISGIIASIQNPGMFWVHNDSGDEARFFLIDSAAQLKQIYYLEGVDAIDLEDIAWVELDGKAHIILGDIGDNVGKRDYISIYVFPEPIYAGNTAVDTISENAIRHINLQYPGKPRDSEAFFVDPADKHLYLISKREFNSVLYTAAIFKDNKSNYSLKPVLKFPFTFVTAADIAHNRDAVIMKNLTNVYYWKLDHNDTIVEALRKSHFTIPYEPEPQGEALTFDRFTDGFFTISERPFGLDSYLYYYNLKKP